VPPPPAAREKVLDSFQRLLIERGARETTLDAVAKAAGVSKGGLLYHFGSREALIEGLLARLQAQADADLVSMKAAPEGPAAYYIRTSASAQTPLDLSLLAATRLLQRSHPRTREVLAGVHDRWYDVLRSAAGDPAVARLIMLIGDGMYYGATLSGAESGPSAAGPDVGEVLELVDELVRSRAATGTSRPSTDRSLTDR